jgi:hypothetical protein
VFINDFVAAIAATFNSNLDDTASLADTLRSFACSDAAQSAAPTLSPSLSLRMFFFSMLEVARNSLLSCLSSGSVSDTLEKHGFVPDIQAEDHRCALFVCQASRRDAQGWAESAETVDHSSRLWLTFQGCYRENAEQGVQETSDEWLQLFLLPLL